MDFDSYARRLWAGRADAYEHGFARLTVHAVGALLDAARVGTGTRVLDVGTGPGVVAGAAVARGARVTAVDAEPSMAEAAARNVPGLDVRVAVLPDLPLPAAGFDAVTGNFVIHATGDPAAVLAQLRRVLRAGGRLALTCWSEPFGSHGRVRWLRLSQRSERVSPRFAEAATRLRERPRWRPPPRGRCRRRSSCAW
jgi:ubiquinone/menaquinone biosynthesis C-methylase UbiE